jgi:hypothetical protein
LLDCVRKTLAFNSHQMLPLLNLQFRPLFRTLCVQLTLLVFRAFDTLMLRMESSSESSESKKLL